MKMEKSYILIFAIFISSCSAGLKNSHDFREIQMTEMLIPTTTLEELMHKELISRREIENIVETYAAKEEQAEAVPPPNANYFACGGVWFDDRKEFDDKDLFKLIGITEKWIPINGKPIKFLHFRLAE